ncbi:MAG: portal protein [Sphingobium sp.]|uniref:portal protein n=1 Tax=Sphingobium sp. TaxID=1912891 RepID=UPI003BAED9F9
MFDAQRIINDQEEMAQERRPFETMMQECAELLLPRQSNFRNLAQMYQGHNLTTQIFDEYAQQALEQGVSLFEGYVMPRGQIWQRFELDDEALMKSQRVRAWVDAKNAQLFALRNDPRSGFAGQVHESIASLFCFGMQSTWPDIRRDVAGRAIGLSYKSEFIGQIYVREDANGLIDTIHHAFPLRARQAMGKWGEAAPEAVKKAIRDNTPEAVIDFIHVIAPNRAFQAGRLDASGKPWAGAFVCKTGGAELFQTGGYRVMPRIVSRFINAPNESYGRCPAFTILPAVRATQQMMVDIMVASELSARPPMGAHSDLADQMIRYAAGEITYGAIDSRGQQLLRPLMDGADLQPAMAMLDKLHGHIDRAFYVDMLQIRNELKSHVTDSQLYQRDEEKGMLLGPFANQETEWLSPMQEREIDLMDELGLLDDMPEEAIEAMDDGVGLKTVYDNGLSRAQEAGAAAGYFRMREQYAGVAANDPEAWAAFNRKYPPDKVLDKLGRINGVPASWEASDEEREDAEQEAANRQSIADVLAVAESASGTAKNLSQMVPANAV